MTPTEEIKADIIAEFERSRSVAAVIDTFRGRVGPAVVRDVLEPRKHLSLSRFPRRDAATEDDLLLALSKANVAGAQSVAAYQAYRAEHPELSMPSAQTIILRFGSWSAARDAARLPTRRRAIRSTSKSFSDDQISDAVRAFVEFAREEKIKPTQQAYDRFARDSEDKLPLLSTVRARFSKSYATWTQIIRAHDSTIEHTH